MRATSGRVIEALSSIIIFCASVMFYLAKILLFLTMVIIVYEVVSRYIFNSPTIWVVDVSRYCLVYITFLGAPFLLLKKWHVNVDLLITHLSPRGRLIMEAVGQALSAICVLIVVLFAAATTWENYIRKTLVIDPIEIPKWIPLVIIPVGLLFLCLTCIVRVTQCLTELKALPGKGADR